MVGKSLGIESVGHSGMADPSPVEKGRGLGAFRGTFEHALDDKGRVSLPAAFRQKLQSKSGTPNETTSVVITNFICDGARCLDGYTLSAWEEFESTLHRR